MKVQFKDIKKVTKKMSALSAAASMQQPVATNAAAGED